MRSRADEALPLSVVQPCNHPRSGKPGPLLHLFSPLTLAPSPPPPCSGAYTDFQLDSLVSTPLPCSEFWQLGAAGYPPSEAAYRLGLIAVVEDIAASLGAASASLVQSVNTLCFPADTDLKRMR